MRDDSDDRSGQPLELATLGRDNELLDALGRGGPAPAGDDLAVLLAAWRDDIAGDLPAGTLLVESLLAESLLAESLAPQAETATLAVIDPATIDPGSTEAAGTVPATIRAAATGMGTDGSAAAVSTAPSDRPHADVVPLGPRQAAGSARRTPRRPRFQIGVAAAVAAVMTMSGLLTAAADAGPNSPLWPITRVFYQDRAESRQAQQEVEGLIAQARTVAAEGRRDDALRLLDEAEARVPAVHEPAVARRLLAEVDEIRRRLVDPLTTGSDTPSGPGDAPGPGNSSAPGAPSPGSPGGQPPGVGSPTPPEGVPAVPTPSPRLPGVPTPPGPGVPYPTPVRPAPTLPVPIPSLPVPPLPVPPLPSVPVLPIPGLGLDAPVENPARGGGSAR